jgi:hypothetical protein
MTIGLNRFMPGRARPHVGGRGWLGTALALVGVALEFLGWYGVSGRATIGEQVPYLASASIPGAALIVAAAVVLTAESSARTTQPTDALVADLHALLVDVSPIEAATAAVEAPLPDTLVVPRGGEHFHRADCVLVNGKSGVEVLHAEAIDRRGLSACPVCEPDRSLAQ